MYEYASRDPYVYNKIKTKWLMGGGYGLMGGGYGIHTHCFSYLIMLFPVRKFLHNNIPKQREEQQ